MRIACPSCTATYDVPDAVVAAGRMLRCSGCNTDFAARAPDRPSAPIPPAAEVQITDAERLAPAPARPVSHAAEQPPKLVLAAWALSFLVICAAAWAAMAWRVPIMQAWPASTRLYAALGYLH